MTTKRMTLIVFLALLLAACGSQEPPMPTPDVGAIQTAAAQTVMAEIRATQNAAASLTPLASPTAEAAESLTESLTESAAESPTPTVTVVVLGTPVIVGTPLGLCDDSNYNPATVDVNIPDDTEMTPGQEFLKTWKIRNTGACTWGAGYAVVFAYGERMNGTPAAISIPVLPNQEVEVSVQFKAPTKAGQYSSTWRMANARGSAFGEFFFVRIIVR